MAKAMVTAEAKTAKAGVTGVAEAMEVEGQYQHQEGVMQVEKQKEETKTAVG